MKISIVIPVYNEAAGLSACIQAIERQIARPHEVIVVDNNSTDGTAAVAAAFDFVTVLREPRQGVIHARTRGFNAASGDIIARIDADTILPPEWTARIMAIFHDESIDAVSGAAHYYDFALDRLADGIDGYFRARLARKLKNTNFLWGANMAVRRSAWLKTRSILCCQPNLHEDFDLAIHMQALGLTVVYDENLVASVSSRRIDTGLLSYLRYTLVSPRTYARHRLSSRRHMYTVVLICWLCYLPGRLIYRGYDPLTNKFSWARLMSAKPMVARVDPTTNVV